MRYWIIVLAILASLLSGSRSATAQQLAIPCGVPMTANPTVNTAISALGPGGGPMIYYNPQFFLGFGMNGPLLFAFMQAHECGHQANGDVIASMMNPMGMLMINPQIELRADCYAAKALKAAGAIGALQFAINYWAQYGNLPTGPNYPTGLQRAQMLSSC